MHQISQYSVRHVGLRNTKVSPYSRNIMWISSKGLKHYRRMKHYRNTATRKNAFHLHRAATKSEFIICVGLIVKYSALLQPAENALQPKSIDMLQCMSHIKRILGLVKGHRETGDIVSQDILADANTITENLGIVLQLPRIVAWQRYRSNSPTRIPAEFWNRSLFIPYLDSLITSLEQRFSNENLPAFSLLILHPYIMLGMTIGDFIEKAESFFHYYNLNNFFTESELRYNLWKDKKKCKKRT